MGFFGKLIAAPIKVVNAPLKAVDVACCKMLGTEYDKNDPCLSGLGEQLADAVEEIVDDVINK